MKPADGEGATAAGRPTNSLSEFIIMQRSEDTDQIIEETSVYNADLSVCPVTDSSLH